MRRKRIVAAALAVGAALIGLAHCGGSTGREGLAVGAQGAVDGAADVTLDARPSATDSAADQTLYTNTFDAEIDYVDRVLPDVQAPPEGGDEAGPGIPDCPLWHAFDDAGNVVANPGNEVPTDYSTANEAGVVPAADGGVCATYPWLGSQAVDECAVANYDLADPLRLPVCSWAKDGGMATQGAESAGRPRYDLCVAMYECFMRTRCFLNPGTPSNNPIGCFCAQWDPRHQTANPLDGPSCAATPGPCFHEMIGAFDAVGSTLVDQATSVMKSHFGTIATNVPGYEGLLLYSVFSHVTATAGPAGCYPACALPDAGRDCGW